MGSLSDERWGEWFGPNETDGKKAFLTPEEHYERIRRYSAWHYENLPIEQPIGWDVWWWAFLELALWKVNEDAPQEGE